jgi:phage tail-like protein
MMILRTQPRATRPALLPVVSMRTSMQAAQRKSVFAIFAIGTAAVSGFAAEPSPQRLLAQRFAVTVNHCQADLGSWPKITGVDAAVDLAEYRSGGRAISFTRYLRPSLNDGTVTLSRSASNESEFVQDWLAQRDPSYEPVTVDITLLDSADQPVKSWELSGVVPLHWQISAFEPARLEIATEILVLAHEGLAPEGSPSRCEHAREEE